MKFEILVDTETKMVSCKKDGQEVQANFGRIYFDKSSYTYEEEDEEYTKNNDMCSISFGMRTGTSEQSESGGWAANGVSVKELSEKISAAVDRTIENIKGSRVIASILRRK